MTCLRAASGRQCDRAAVLEVWVPRPGTAARWQTVNWCCCNGAGRPSWL